MALIVSAIALATATIGLSPLGGVVAAARPSQAGGKEKAGTVVDSGFRPPTNGFRFANYGNNPEIPDLGPEEMQALFGSAVCASGTGAGCVLTPPALAWMQETNAEMADGHCLGFSITALLLHAGLLTPAQFGASAVPDLSIGGNDLLAREIAYAWAFQLLPAVTAASVHGTPSAVLAQVESDLRTGGQLYTLAITKPGGAAGHAVTPYEVKRTGPGRYTILVYDNNYPDVSRRVLVDTATNRWTYQAAPTPGQPESTYTGNASSNTLYLVPTKPGLGVQPCPFCSAATSASGSAIAARAAGTTRLAPDAARRAVVNRTREETISLHTSGAAAGTHLMITDHAGHRLGFVGSRLLDAIPGASVVPLLSASPRTWRDGSAAEFVVPAGTAYTISLTHASSRRHHRARTATVADAHASVDVLGPGFVAEVRSVDDGAGSSSSIAVPASGDGVTFTPRAGGAQTPELVVGTGQPGATGHEWTAVELGSSAPNPVSISLDPATDMVGLSGEGTYDVSLDTVGSTVTVFGHNDLSLGAGVTASVDYAGEEPGAGLPVTDSVDGVVTGTSVLSDEPTSFDDGSEFSEPDEGPALTVPVGSTADDSTTVVSCSPDSVAVDDQTTCTATVSADDGIVPTGEVAFDSPFGAFADDTCTLDDTGACAVAFTPSDVGSGTQPVDAVYGGDDGHVSSEDTADVDVELRTTDTTTSCDPSAGVAPGDSTTCTATVTDVSGGTVSTPTGSVTFATDDSSGSFPDGASCTLAATSGAATASCSLSYTVGNDTAPEDAITASYGGDPLHASS